MPWAVWVVAALMAAMAIPSVGYWVAYFTMIFTFLAMYSLPAIIQDAIFGDLNGSGVHTSVFVARQGAARLTGWPYLWGLFGWTGVVWLATLCGLCLWIAVRMRGGESARGLTNLAVLIAGWPACFWFAMRVLATAAPR